MTHIGPDYIEREKNNMLQRGATGDEPKPIKESVIIGPLNYTNDSEQKGDLSLSNLSKPSFFQNERPN